MTDKPLADNGDNLIERADELAATAARSDPQAAIDSIIRAGNRRDRTNRILVVGVTALFVFVAAFGVLANVARTNANRASAAVRLALSNAENAYEACLLRNELRLTSTRVWEKYRELKMRPGPLTADEQVLLDELVAFTADGYKPTHCNRPTGLIPVP